MIQPATNSLGQILSDDFGFAKFSDALKASGVWWAGNWDGSENYGGAENWKACLTKTACSPNHTDHNWKYH